MLTLVEVLSLGKVDPTPAFTFVGSNKGKPIPLSDPGVNYNPTKSNYHPIDDTVWKHKEK